jgi:hypothetical protein
MDVRDASRLRLHAGDPCRISSWRNVLIVDVLSSVDVADVRRMEDATKRHLRAHPGGVVGLTILRRGIPMGTSGARKEASRVLRDLARDFGDGLRRNVIFIEDSGTALQLLTSVLRALFLVAGVRKFVICKTLEEAAEAVLPELLETTGAVSRAEVIDGVHHALSGVPA